MWGRNHRKNKIISSNLSDEINHGIRVSNLTFDVAEEMGLPYETCYQFAIAGMLHDIGKLMLNGYINGEEQNPLLIEELKYVRMHSTLSYDVLKGQGYSDMVLESILHHHENYDGTGYPSNLSGKEIPLGARILRVCDTYEALCSERAYRDAYDKEMAMELMIEETKHFDLEVFLAFQRVVHKKDEEEKDGIKEKTCNRDERHITKGDGNPQLCDEHDS